MCGSVVWFGCVWSGVCVMWGSRKQTLCCCLFVCFVFSKHLGNHEGTMKPSRSTRHASASHSRSQRDTTLGNEEGERWDRTAAAEMCMSVCVIRVCVVVSFLCRWSVACVCFGLWMCLGLLVASMMINLFENGIVSVSLLA